jgi:hypothetical protein
MLVFVSVCGEKKMLDIEIDWIIRHRIVTADTISFNDVWISEGRVYRE